MTSTPLIVLGCGYIGSHVARAALAAGRQVRVCGRSTGKLAALGGLGAQVKYVDAAMTKQLWPALAGMRGGTVLYSIPPIGSLPPGEGPRKALQAAAAGGLECFVHLSSSGLYGFDPDDDVWIDDATPVVLDDGPMGGVRNDEEAVRTSTYGVRTVTLRLAPVYGPGRGVRVRVRQGSYRLLDDGVHAISRIHVDDVAQLVMAAEDRAASGATYLVADAEPTTQRAYAEWLCQRLGLPLPPSRALLEPGKPRGSHRNRKFRGERILADLGVTLKYPTFRDGEVAIEEAEAAEAAAPTDG